jgi:hypothetical protein
MQTTLKGLVMGLVVLGLGLTSMGAKAKAGSEKEFTFKGKLEAVKVVVDKQDAEKVTAKVAVISEGKEIATGKVVMTRTGKNKEIWAGEFTVKAKVAEKAAVKVQAIGEATFKSVKARKLEGDKKVNATKDTVEVGTIKLAFVKKEIKK